MECFYVLEGDKKSKKFKSELELDEYLLQNKKLYDKYKDIVFNQFTTKLAYSFDVLNEKLKEAKEIFTKHTKSKDKFSEWDNNDIENVDIKEYDDYIGTTKFLSGLTLDGKLLFPEFISKNYFNLRIAEWKNNRFSTEEKQLLFKNNATRIPSGDGEIKLWIKAIKNLWKNQGLIGTELHKVGQLFFELNKELRHLTTENIFSLLKSQINPEYVPDKILTKAIDYYKGLEYELNNEFNPTGKGELIFYPEYKISGEAQDIGGKEGPKKILGIIDLLVIDSNGHPHIVDYKTSPHDYALKNEENGYSTAKILAFKYLLAVYERLLKNYGIYTGSTKLLVAPILILNFRKEKDKWVYDDIKKYEGYTDILSKEGMERINDNLDEIFYEPETLNITSDKLISSTTEDMSKLFPNIKFTTKLEDIENMVQKSFKENAKFNLDTNLWEYVYNNTGTIVQAKTEQDLYDSILKQWKKWPSRRIENVRRIKDIIRDATSDPENIDFNVNFINKYDKVRNQDSGISSYLNIILKLYIHPGWKLLENDFTIPFEHLGMILFQKGDLIDVVKLSTSDLYRLRLIIRGRKYITGNFEDDNIELNKPNFSPLLSTYGNMELMEAMIALNKVPELFYGKYLGEVRVINTHMQEGNQIYSSKLLLDNYNELSKFAHLDKNYFKSGDIKILDMVHLSKNKVHDIINFERNRGYKNSNFKDIKTTIDSIDECIDINPEIVRSKFITLQKLFELAYPELKLTTADKTKLTEEKVMAYNYLTLAIGELDGIHWNLILSDHNNYLESMKIWTNGFLGLRIDNPGNTESPFLNKLTKLVMEAYLNSRFDLQKSLSEIRDLVLNLKDEKNFGYLKERTIGNQVNLYENMIEYYDGEIFLKNPWDNNSKLTVAETNFLKYILTKFNERKYNGKSEAFIEEKRRTPHSEYYWLPLAKGSTNSMVFKDGVLKTLKYKFKSLLPKQIVQNAMDRDIGVGNKIASLISKVFTPEDKQTLSRLQIWEMTNRFNAGYSEERSNIIKSRGSGYFELNLETLFIEHEFAYILKKNIDRIFPDIKAASIYLHMSELIKNDQFLNTAKYLSDFVRAKVLNQPLVDPKYLPLEEYRKMLMGMTSKLALAFSPVLAYQIIEGLWKDISLIYRKPDGTQAFSLKNMKDSFFDVYSELAHFGNGHSKLELLNELYGINDKNQSTYVRSATSDLRGFFHFWDALGFRTSSRPDFYNRFVIFESQMREDGCFDAYIKKGEQLIYDWTLDSRFNVFCLGESKGMRTNAKKYLEQKGLYYAMGKLMINEGTKMRNAEGELVEFLFSNDPEKPTPLPKAYTTQQSEGYKDLADMLYGYYTDEKKSLIQTWGLGALFMLMYTYLSGKKTQYFANSRISIMGKMKQYEENGVKYWLKLDENGNLTDIPTEDASSGVPYIVWKGLFHEGIIVTLSQLARELVQKNPEDNSIVLSQNYKNYKEKYLNNKDADISNAYISNLKLLLYDIFMWMVAGSLVAGSLENAANDYIKELGNDTMKKAIANSALALSTKILNHSFLDFNFIESIFGRGVDWTPFALETTGRTLQYFGSCFMGDETFMRTLAKSTAATRSFSYLNDYLFPKPEKEE